MGEKIPIDQLSRQPLVRGTSCFTTPDGNVGYKNEDVQASALVRIAAALERQNELTDEIYGRAALLRNQGTVTRSGCEVTLRITARSGVLARRLYDQLSMVMLELEKLGAEQEGGQVDA